MNNFKFKKILFTPKTQKISGISKKNGKSIQQLEKLLKGKVYMYIDYANVRPWSEKLKWHIDLKRLKQFLDSFDNVHNINFYNGTLIGNKISEKETEQIKNYGFKLRTKPVKIMKFSIDATSVPSDSIILLEHFIRQSLLRKYNGETIEYLNNIFKKMNDLGEYLIEDRKCNFDVEIGVDMLIDSEKKEADTFVLWSGDSDFHDPVQKLLRDGKNVILFATARKIAKELNELRKEGLIIFDIRKIRDFICWNREYSKRDFS